MSINEQDLDLFYSRDTDYTSISCEACGWEGRICDCYHGYAPIFNAEVEAANYCPECGSDDLLEKGSI